MLHRSGLGLCSIRGGTTLTQLGHPKQKVAMAGRKEQKERSYPESNRGRPDVLHHDVVLIRTGSDNRYTIEPFLVHRLESSQSMVQFAAPNIISPLQYLDLMPMRLNSPILK